MLCEETNLDLLYKWKNKSHTKGPNIYTSLKAEPEILYLAFYFCTQSFCIKKYTIKAPAKEISYTDLPDLPS